MRRKATLRGGEGIGLFRGYFAAEFSGAKVS